MTHNATTVTGPTVRGSRARAATKDEIALIHRVAGKDDAAFACLYRDYYPRLRRFIERATGRPQIVEEVLDDTMLVVWRKAGSYNLRSKVSTWIFGIARRRAMSAVRRVDAPVDFDADTLPDSRDAGPEAMLERRERRARIVAALAALSPEHREVVELTFFDGYSCAEIARIVSCPINTVKTRMFHARRRLKTLLADAPGTR